MNDQEREYVCSVTLVVLGEDLNPELVSESLQLDASQCWRRGERSLRLRDGTTRFRDSAYEWGGWKRFVADEQKDETLEEQLEWWVQLLRPRIAALRKLRLLGLDCALNVFISTSETASIVLSNHMQKEVAGLGLELRVSLFAHSESEQAVSVDRPKTRSG